MSLQIESYIIEHTVEAKDNHANHRHKKAHCSLAVVILHSREVGQMDQNHRAGEEPLAVAHCIDTVAS